MNVGELILERRNKKGITLQKLSGLLGISISYLSRIESGKRNINQVLIKKISKTLAIPEKDLEIAIIMGDVVNKYGTSKYYKESIKNLYEQTSKG